MEEEYRKAIINMVKGIKNPGLLKRIYSYICISIKK